ncbi:hypothetical protein [Yersinia proxima]|uniref:hypothetical protein n=1 Tax=Yersinia proxima TaxID=2890316 RepID=UPI001D12E747|nr:hypothetical protein [Yersinia proxima]
MPATQEDRLYGLTTSVAVKPAVAISADYNITLFGEQTITSSTFTGERTVTTTTGMRVLVMGQSSPIDNGIWIASPATWHRAPDFDGARDAVNGTLVFSIYGDCWQLEAADPVQIGYSALEFRSTYPFAGEVNLFVRSLRVPEASVGILPPISGRANHLLAFNNDGEPIAVLPESGSASDVLIDLASTVDGKGDALIGVKQPFTGTIGRTQHNVNLEKRSVFDFPGTWDGVADDTAGFQTAVNSFGLIGGTLHIPNIAKVYLAGAVTIPGGVSISGDMKCPGAPGLPHLLGNIFKLGSQIRINPAITVSLGGGNAINNVVITRSTMTGPEVNAANYTGTAFTQIAADVRFESIICVGFTHLISCTGFARTVLNKSGIDTVGGVYVKDAGDPPEATNNHFWPYGTASASGAITTPDTNHFIYRSGAGLYFENCAWPLVSGNFILGHSDQGIAKDCSNPRVFGNGFSGINLGDVSPYVLGSTGFRVEGTTNNSAIDANVSVHLEHGIYLNSTDVNGRQTVTNQVCRNVKTTGVVVLGGNASIQANVEGRIASSAGVRVIGVNSKVLIDGCQLYNNLNGIQAEGALHKIGDNTFIGNATNILETADPFSIAAVTANMGTIPDKDYYYVTGAVSNIASFRDTFNGHEITMTFASACTLVNTGNLRISGSPLSIAAGASIKFVCLGKSGSRTWRQLTAPL